MRLIILVGCGAMLLSVAARAEEPSALRGPANDVQRGLVSAWGGLNEACRGGYGDEVGMYLACERRSVISQMLSKYGCRHHKGDYWTCARD